MATEVVQHGRRKGSLRSPGSKHPSPSQAKTVVVAAEEWARIKGSLSSASEAAEQRQVQLDARQALHQHSKTIVSNWQNTIEGQRLKKLQAKRIREEKEEEEKVKVDVEEAKYQSERRKEAIERAKTLLYYQTDRVKQFHGALLLSEVLRERDSQVEYKKRKAVLQQRVDDKFLRWQEQERERGILVDMKAAEERATAKDEVARFQISQVSRKCQAQQKEREEALEEQAQIDKEVTEFHASQREQEVRQWQQREAFRVELDATLADKQALEQRRGEQEKAEEEEMKVFGTAKKKMTSLRKEKEAELFRQFQAGQQRMCDRLAQQMQQQQSDEDQRIAKAVAEQDAEREHKEREKEQQFLEKSAEIHRHRKEAIADKEHRQQEQTKQDQELLQQRVVQDQKFHAQQLERQLQAAKEAKEMQSFHKRQVAELVEHKMSEHREEEALEHRNMELLKVEEQQFQEYAGKVITEAKARRAYTQPLQRAAKPGAGGGHGPVFSGKGGIRPSYQVMDSTVVELPSYQPKAICRSTNTQKRMGFTW